MHLLDVNIVLASHREDHEHHEVVRSWFDDLVESGYPFMVPDVVWASLVRLATNRRIFKVPSPSSDVFEFVRATTLQPGYVTLESTGRALQLFEKVCIDYEAAGDLVPDAFLAAMAMEHGCQVVSLDRDFARFETVTWLNPIDLPTAPV